MLLACRLTGLSALEGHDGGRNGRTQQAHAAMPDRGSGELSPFDAGRLGKAGWEGRELAENSRFGASGHHPTSRPRRGGKNANRGLARRRRLRAQHLPDCGVVADDRVQQAHAGRRLAGWWAGRRSPMLATLLRIWTGPRLAMRFRTACAGDFNEDHCRPVAGMPRVAHGYAASV
jgi:hypothetical protein